MKYFAFAVLTALCWGLYGPALAQARSEAGSPFKPYVAIGFAYLIWGLVGGVGGMLYQQESFGFTGAAGTWGFLAGTLGAWGALALTLSMFTGGHNKAHVVMSIVFGGAVTITALVSAWQTRGQQQNPWLWVGIGGILICAIVVAFNTPRAAPARPGSSAPAHAAAQPPAAPASGEHGVEPQ